MVHRIKIDSQFFDDAAAGRKTFELRKNDRGYKVGDVLALTDYKDGKPTGREIYEEVAYMLENYKGLEDGYCILATRLLENAKEAGIGAGQEAGQLAAYGA